MTDRLVSKPILAASSGILAALAMPGFGAWPLVFISLVPLFYAVDGKNRFACAFLFAAAFFALDLRWLLTLYRFSPLIIPGFLLLIAYLSLFFALLGLIIRFRNRPGGALFIVTAALWFSLFEYLRTFGPLGIGFSDLYQSLYRVPALIQAASYIGPWPITALVAAVNASFYLALDRKKARYALTGVLLIGAMAVFAAIPHAEVDPSTTVAIVSSNVDQETKLEGKNLSALTDRYLLLGERAASGGPQLIVFPESILPAYILREEDLSSRFARLAEESGAAVLLGTGDHRNGRIYNSVAVFLPDRSIVETYEMVRPVPFGEYIPGRRIWEAIGLKRLVDSFLPHDLSRGREYSPIEGIGTPICFESTFPSPSRRFVENGATLLVTVTNDAWFRGSSELKAHFAAAVFRAVENRRFTIQAANGGISGIIDPTGRIEGSTREEGVLRGKIGRLTSISPYSRWGDLPFLTLAGIGLVLIIISRMKKKRRGLSDPRPQ